MTRAIALFMVLGFFVSTSAFGDGVPSTAARRGHTKKVVGALMIAAGSALFVAGAATLGGVFGSQVGHGTGRPDDTLVLVGFSLLASSLLVPAGVVVFVVGGHQIDHANQLQGSVSLTPLAAHQGLTGATANLSLRF